MNQELILRHPIKNPFQSLFAFTLEWRYRIPRLGKGVILKNTINATNEEILGCVQSLPLFRLYKDKIIDLIGFNDYDIETNQVICKPKSHVAVKCTLSHNAEKPYTITLGDFKYYDLTDKGLTVHKPEDELWNLYFHELSPVMQTKTTPVELFFFATTSWFEHTHVFSTETYQELWPKELQEMALIEYNNILPYFQNNLSTHFIRSFPTYDHKNPDNPWTLNLEIDCPETISNKDLLKVIKFIMNDYHDWILTKFEDLPKLTFQKNEIVNLEKTSDYRNLFLYVALVLSGLDDLMFNSSNLIKKDIKINPEKVKSMVGQAVKDLEKDWLKFINSRK